MTGVHHGVRSADGGMAEPGGHRSAPNRLAQLMSLYIVVAVGRIVDLLPGLHNIPLAKIVAAIAVITLLRNPAVYAGTTWKSVPPARMTIALMGFTTLSILWSVLRSASLGVITGTALAVTVTLLLVIKAANGWGAVKTILNGAVLSSTVLVALVMTSRVADSNGYRAGVSGSYDPNDFAFVLVGLLPLVATFGIISNGSRRIVYFCIAGFMSVAILLTQSRGGFLGFITVVILMTFLLPVARRNKLHFRLSTSGLFTRAVVLTVLGVFVWSSLPESARARLETITQLGSDYNASATSEGANAGRLAIWNRNLPLVFKQPWGFGAGSFEFVDGRFAGGRYRAPHNTLLEALIELGIPGFLLFISTIVSSLRFLRTPQIVDHEKLNTVDRDEPRAFARGLAIGWMGLCVSGFFLSMLFSNMIWTYVALSCAVGIIRRQPATTTAGKKLKDLSNLALQTKFGALTPK